MDDSIVIIHMLMGLIFYSTSLAWKMEKREKKEHSFNNSSGNTRFINNNKKKRKQMGGSLHFRRGDSVH